MSEANAPLPEIIPEVFISVVFAHKSYLAFFSHIYISYTFKCTCTFQIQSRLLDLGSHLATPKSTSNETQLGTRITRYIYIILFNDVALISL